MIEHNKLQVDQKIWMRFGEYDFHPNEMIVKKVTPKGVTLKFANDDAESSFHTNKFFSLFETEEEVLNACLESAKTAYNDKIESAKRFKALIIDLSVALDIEIQKLD